jgi:hypothetical protein
MTPKPASKIPSRSEIVRWWYSYLMQESKSREWDELLKSYPSKMVGMDIGEPDCWTCGGYNSKFSDIQEYLDRNNISEEKYEKDPDKYLWKMWNEASLDRHHIIPKSRGGSNDPENFVLLCDSCHQKAPHTTDVDYFWEWARGREKQKADQYLNAAKEAAQLAGFNFEKDTDVILETFLALKNQERRLHGELISDMSSILTFHGYGDPVAYFRDELYCALKVVKQKGWNLKKSQIQKIQNPTKWQQLSFA